MTTEEFLKDVCPNHTNKSKWNKSELLHILELHTKQLRKHDVIESLPQDNFCKVCNLPTDGEKCYSKRCPI